MNFNGQKTGRTTPRLKIVVQAQTNKKSQLHFMSQPKPKLQFPTICRRVAFVLTMSLLLSVFFLPMACVASIRIHSLFIHFSVISFLFHVLHFHLCNRRFDNRRKIRVSPKPKANAICVRRKKLEKDE